MPYYAEWYIPYRVMLTYAYDDFTVEDLYKHTEARTQFLAEAREHNPDQLVYQLFDASKATSFPPAYLIIPGATPVLRYQNRGPMFVVTQNPTIRSIMELTAHVFEFSVQFFATRDEGIKVIEKLMDQEDLKKKT